jgi:hypothetical protein
MEYGKIGSDGTGSHINPNDMHLPAATTESLYTSQIAYWDLKTAAQMNVKQNFPGLGQRDLLPSMQVGSTDPGFVFKGRPNPTGPLDYFAIANRADGMPVEVLRYSADQAGHLTYKDQYLLRYQDLTDGTNRVTVQKWAPIADSDNVGNAPVRTIGDQQNMLLGISQYYRNGNQTTRAEYWKDASITQPPPAYGPKPTGDYHTPDVRITFNDGTNNIGFQKKGLSGLLSGVIPEYGTQAKNELLGVLPQFNFYDLFGPKL